ncbi:UbiX family flavin prenyltransferase [Cohaesibacter sp. CAU 1516]|uniref:UbiX family flavin prenyltransferase n=1 Tax=Cohaesibacter sp. CAU 1516 TaxID=2576038 RepID=UPI0014851348|nr:UbiX family flavin prenyltransferase [Cohaesibacter sp. CAU 1516]
MTNPTKKKIGIVVSGASGSVLALESLKLLRQLAETDPTLQIHAILTDGGRQTASLELESHEQALLESLPDHLHDDRDLTASIASGSNPLDALLIVPCSVRSLSAVAHSQTDRLSIRAADVMLKERRTLVLAVRESPLHLGHLQAMQMVTQMGGIIAPPLPAYYLKPQSITELARQNAARLLSLCGLPVGDLMQRWRPETPSQS